MNKRCNLKKWAIAGMTAFSMLSFGVLKPFQTVRAEEIILPDADLSKGVTYVTNDTGGVSAINLNGNSAIIKSVKVGEGTDAVTFLNIYLDKNSNGKIDSGETAAKLVPLDTDKYGTDPSENIVMGPPVYGLYAAKSSTPIRITLQDTVNIDIYGVYGGEITGDVEMVADGGSASNLYGASSSKVDGNINVSVLKGTSFNGSVYACYGASSATGNINIDVNSSSVSGVIYGLNGSSTIDGNLSVVLNNATIGSSVYGEYGACKVKGKVDMTVGGSQISSNLYAITDGSSSGKDVTITVGGSKVYGVYGVNSGSSAGGYLKTDIISSETSYLYALQSGSTCGGNDTVNIISSTIDNLYANGGYGSSSGGCTVNGNVYVTIDEYSTWKNNVYGTGYSTVNGDLIMNVAGMSENSTYYGYIYGTYGDGSTNATQRVTGDVTVNINGGKVYSVYGSYNTPVNGNVKLTLNDTKITSNCYGVYGRSDVGVSGKADTGDFTMDINNSEISGYLYAVYGNGSGSLLNIFGDYIFSMDETSKFSGSNYNYISEYATIHGNAKADVYNANDTKDSPTLYGFYYSNLLGDLDIEIHNGNYYSLYGVYGGGTSGSYSSVINGSAVVNIHDCKADNVYGIYSVHVDKDIDVDIVNVDKRNNSGYIYGLSGVDASSENTSDVSVNITDSTGMNYIYGISGGSFAKADNTSVTLKNIETSGSSYAVNTYSGSFGGDLLVTIDNDKAEYLYGAYANNIDGNVTVNFTNSEIKGAYASYLTHVGGDVTITASGNTSIVDSGGYEGSFYDVLALSASQCVVDGKVTVNHSDDNIINYNGIAVMAAKGAEVNFEGGSIKHNGNFYNGSGGGTKDATNINVKVSGTEFLTTQTGNATNGYTDELSFYSSVGSNQTLNIDVDGTCVLPDNYNVGLYATGTDDKLGAAYMKCNGTLYVSGNVNITDELLAGVDSIELSNMTYEFEKNFKLKNISFNSCNIAVRKGVTLEATNTFNIRYGSMVVEGTVKGDITCNNAYGEEIENGSNFYMNGGSISELPKSVNLYYPVTTKYSESGGTITNTGLSSFTLAGEGLFAKVSSTVSFTATPKTGYHMYAGTYKESAKTAAEDMTAKASGQSTIYSFTMPEDFVAVSIMFAGDSIQIGKTVPDPVAKLNVETIKDNPVYDLATLKILNDVDDEELSIIYEIDDANGLPEGLKLEDGKIFGTPTKAYEDGKNVIIHITGRNMAQADVTINIVVTAGSSTVNPNQNGRIEVNDTSKTIDLFGNSVVIKAYNDATGIYIDDNMDGEADSDIPAAHADYSEYTLYGIRSASTDKPIHIIMTGGKLGNIYVVNEAEINFVSDEEDAVVYKATGGYADKVIIANSSTIKGDVYAEAAAKTCSNPASASYFNVTSALNAYVGTSLRGYIINRAGTYSTAGDYVLKNDMTLPNLSLLRGSSDYTYKYIRIPKGKTLTVEGNVTGYYLGAMLVQGTLSSSGTHAGSSDVILVDGGTVDTGETVWARVYYPINFATNLKEVRPTCSYSTFTVDNNTYNMLAAGTSYNVTVTDIAGYNKAYQIGEEEAVSLEGTGFSYVAPHNASTIKAVYTAKQIELENRFGTMQGNVGTEYTATNPLFDYSKVVISGDTTAAYAKQEKVTYKVSSGNLPKGITLEDGKLIGTTTTAETGTLSIEITGLNGSSKEVGIDYKIDEASSGQSDFDKALSYNTTTKELNLNGNSVVIMEDSNVSGAVNIYPDDDHDGIADSTTAFKSGTSSAIVVNSVVGYSDTSKAYDGDISICLYSGTVSSLYGAKGTVDTKAEVTGDVSLIIRGGTVATETAAAYYADVNNASIIAKAGDVKGKAYTAYMSDIKNDVTLQFTDKARIYISGSYSYRYNTLAATYGGTVKGDVNMLLGSKETAGYGYSYAFASSTGNSNFTGVNGTTVTGNVNCTIDGNFVPRYYMQLISNGSKVTKDLNVTWQSGYVYSYGSSYSGYCSFVNASTVNDVIVTTSENASIYTSGLTFLYGGATARNVVMDSPDLANSISNPGFVGSSDTTSKITGYGYVNNMGAVTVYGNYVREEDLTATSISILQDAVFEIKKGVVLTNSNSANINGTIRNNGTWNNKNAAYIYGSFENKGVYEATGVTYNSGNIDNLADGTMKFTGRLYQNSATAVLNNKGTLTSEYNSSSTSYSYINALYGTVNNEGEWNSKFFYLYGNLTNTGTISFTGLSDNAANIGLYMQSGSTALLKKGGKVTLNSRLYLNNATLYNYGELTIGTTTADNFGYGTYKLFFADAPTITNETITKSYCDNCYYPLTVEFDEDYISEAAVTGSTSSGIEGDDNLYFAKGSTFTVNLTMKGEHTEAEVYRITYANDQKAISKGDGVYTGTMPNGATVASVICGKARTITLNPSSVDIESLTVDVNNNKILDLSTIKIEGDDEEAETSVVYAVKDSAKLPDGITLSNGIISGKPTKASSENQTSVIVITGKNGARAELTVNFKKINQGIPAYAKPTNLYGYTGNTVSKVTLPTVTNGKYEWAEEELDEVIDERAIAGETFKCYFIPTDTENYDWSQVSVGTWDADNKKLALDVNIRLYTIAPTYTVPTNIRATYGNILSEVELPEDENGHFEWISPDTNVGTVTNSRRFYARYVPNDKNRYYTVNSLSIYIAVDKLKKEAPTVTKVNAKDGDTISSITALPESEDGTFTWKTSGTTKVTDGEKYTLLFKPKDTTNIEWIPVGDNASYSTTDDGILYSVVVVFESELSNVTAFPMEYVNAEYERTLQSAKLPYVDGGKWYYDGSELENPLTDATDIPSGKFVWVDPPTEQIRSLTDITAKVKYIPTSIYVDESEVFEVTVKITHNHRYSAGIYEYDETGHYQVCTICGEHTDVIAHKLNQKTEITKANTKTAGSKKTYCMCGYCKSEEIPQMVINVPSDLTATYGDVLSSVSLPYQYASGGATRGSFRWQTPTSLVGEVGANKFPATFTPYDTTLNEVIEDIEITVTVSKQEKTAPTIAEAMEVKEGDTLADVSLPDVEGGHYAWKDAGTTVIVDKTSYDVTFVPNDSDHYTWIGATEAVKLVTKKIGEISVFPLPYVTAEYGKTIAEAALPEVKSHKWYYNDKEISAPLSTASDIADGHFEWVAGTPDTLNTKINDVNDRTAKVKYVADNDEVVVGEFDIKVKVGHAHVYTESYSSDAAGHYRVCTICGESSERESHKFGFATVVTKATETALGEKKYTCSVCDYHYEEAITMEVINDPADMNAVYGDTLSKLTIKGQSDEDGTPGRFVWQDAGDTLVGNVGDHTFMATFKPTDSESYAEKKDIEIKVTVKAKNMTIPEINSELEVDKGAKLSEVSLSEVEGGHYEWVDSIDTLIEDQKTYAIRFVPDDSENYKWSGGTTGITFTVKGGAGNTEPETPENPEKPVTPETPTTPEEPGQGTGQEENKPLSAGTEISAADGSASFTVADIASIVIADESDKADDDEYDEHEDDDLIGVPVVVFTKNNIKDAKEITVPDEVVDKGVTYKVVAIADSAFANEKKLTSVVIGNNVRKIGANTFAGCTSLKSVTFKQVSKVRTIGANAFKGCTALTKITIPASVKYIKNNAFAGAKKLATVTFASGSKCKTIGKTAFKGCTSLKKIVIPDKVTRINDSAFEGCTKMKTVTIGKKVKQIGAKAFYNCKALNKVTVKSSVIKKIGKKAFTKAGSKNYKKLNVKVPSKKKKTYKTMLKKAGLNKKAKVK